MDFDAAFNVLLAHEGGYVNHPSDPGGETRFGISKRSYPTEDIKALTEERAKVIYKRDFWGPAGCDSVPDAIKFDLFDMAVNSGIRQAVRTLQRAAYTDADGILGPKTLLAVGSVPEGRLLARFNGYRLCYMTDLGPWESFSRGWARRIADNLIRE